MTIEEKKIETIVDLLDGNEALTDEQLAQLMQDDEAMRLAKDAMGIKATLAEGSEAVDMDEEWNRLAQRMQSDGEASLSSDEEVEKPSRHIWRLAAFTVSGIAAMMILLFTFHHFTAVAPQDERMAYSRVDGGETDVTVTAKSDNETVAIAEQSASDTTAGALASVQSRIWRALGYETDDVPLDELTISIPAGKTYQLTLPDGTRVWMYAGTKLTYPTRFIGGERNVYLEGEAYFKVTKDAKHPFVIATRDMEARVLGTELCVRSYGNGASHVALINGSVEVKDKAQSDFARLVPGQGATLSNGRLSIASEDMEKYEYWRTGYLYYDDESLCDIATSIGRWYNVNVMFDDLSLRSLQLRFFCRRDESLRKAIDLLNSYGDFEVVYSDDTLHFRK